jgi:murein DD-endopeptidase MepM/ murein hydrolase activator NlpD
MNKLAPIINLIIIFVLLTSCSFGDGDSIDITVTKPPVIQTDQPMPRLPDPSETPIPSITPLKVIPMPGASGTQLVTPVTPVAGSLSATPSPADIQQTPSTPQGPSSMEQYTSQGGDTITIVAKRFATGKDKIMSESPLPPVDELLVPGTILLVPKAAEGEFRTPGDRLMPDSEIVYGPSSIGFNIKEYVQSNAGYLEKYQEYILSGGWTSGAEAVERISLENSLNPRMVIAIIEYESHWVLGNPTNIAENQYPLGKIDYHWKGLFRQLMWASGSLSEGYYRWRSGDLNEITFLDGTTVRLNPFLNAGTAALQYYFAQNHTRAEWEQAVGPNGFSALYAQMFGPTWERASAFEPTIRNGLQQPPLSLPFAPGTVWAFISGPHSAWEKQGALAALDMAPSAMFSGCVTNNAWVFAPAAGEVVRTAKGVVMLDLDGDGYEQTGWVILFLHIRSDEKVVAGQKLAKDDHIGHASCEGGVSTGTHIHIARKYNGEWILADGPIPFDMDGWVAHNGEAPYKGTLTRGDKTVIACTCSSIETNITREK